MEAFTLIEVGFAALPIVTKAKAGQITAAEAAAELCELAAAKGITLAEVASVVRKFGPEIDKLLPKKA